MENDHNNDDAFMKAFEQTEAKSEKTPSTFTAFQPEDLLTTEFDKSGKPRPLQMVGGFPYGLIDDEEVTNPETAVVRTFLEVNNDDGWRTQVYLPASDSHKTHIMNRVFERVTAFTWDKGPDGRSFRVYKLKGDNRPISEDGEYENTKGEAMTYNELFNMFARHKDQTSPPLSVNGKQIFGDIQNGWAGVRKLYANVYDFERYEEMVKNNHSFTLIHSKAPRTNKETKDQEGWWYTKGVKWDGFKEGWAKDLQKFGSWQNYVMWVKKPISAQAPNNTWDFQNASLFKEKDLKELLDGISDETYDRLTPPKQTDPNFAGFEHYDLSEMFKLSSYTFIYNNFKMQFQMVDTALGTNFYRELEDLMAHEVQNAPLTEGTDNGISTPPPVISSASAPTLAPPPKRGAVKTESRTDLELVGLSLDEISTYLKGWDDLVATPRVDAKKQVIKGVDNSHMITKIKKTEVGVEVTYRTTDFTGELVELAVCYNEDCDCVSPNNLSHCPKCGRSYLT